jgi:MFS transporter, DHA3 family, macrolide efflux protein
MSSWKKIFAIIWTGQLFSTLSSTIVGYAVIFWLSMDTKSAEVLALATIAALLPQMIIGPFTGVFIDRWDRRRTMIAADIFIAVCTFIMAMMFITGDVKIPYIYVLLVMRSVGSAFHVPAMQASVPLMAPETELLRISGVNQVIQSLSIIAGPALAALLISVLNMTWALMFDVLGALIAVVTLLMVHIPNPAKKKDAPPPHVLREMLEGMRVIYSHRGLLWVFIIIVLAYFFIMPVSALFPLMTINHFGGGTYQMSFVEIAWGVGMLAGGALLGIKKIRISEITMINATFIVLGLTFALSGVLPASGFWIFAGLTLIGGITMSIYSGAFMVVMQTTIEPELLGRVLSIYGSLTMLPSMFGLMQTGYIADTIGVSLAFVISGCLITLMGIVAFFIPAIRAMRKKPESDAMGSSQKSIL